MVTAKIEKALTALSSGNLIILVDRNGHGKLMSFVEKTTPEHINFMITHGRGLVSVGLEKERAKQLEIEGQQTANADKRTQAFTVSVDVEGTTTGISTFERHETIKALIDPKKNRDDFKRPGHIFPVLAHEKGIYGKQAHTEAGVTLANLSDCNRAVVLCDVLNAEGELASMEELKAFSLSFQLDMLKIDELLQYCLLHEPLVQMDEQTKLKNQVGEFEVITFSNEFDLGKDYLFYYKKLHSKKVTPVYIHKQCNHFELMLCECQQKLESAMTKLKKIGGVGLFLAERKEIAPFGKETYNTILIVQLLKSIGLNNIHLLNKYPLFPSVLHECGINLMDVSGENGLRKSIV
ncbi:3,4-dihydroxy-2-butanone-4-phosphate synthase [Halalkalibacterium ligniniphilum]|uniref:3,4-dihydroxy-2-butanone-4-phosphate synthase n=1 Tax=Halalkalibacterium ligniniphilum TaxID=1134413 RepID=UPI000346780A|nr:3,4-dihydroxy-2-butanone-4-phosphate synthase [Halalkalibacterium ligniniphilum]